MRRGKPRLLRADQAEDGLRSQRAVASTGHPGKPLCPLPTRALRETAMLTEGISPYLPKLEGFRSQTVPSLLSSMALEGGGFLSFAWHLKSPSPAPASKAARRRPSVRPESLLSRSTVIPTQDPLLPALPASRASLVAAAVNWAHGEFAEAQQRTTAYN